MEEEIMFDKITIKSKLSIDECAFLATYHRLKDWTNAEKTQVEYKSSEYSNITGIEIKIMNNQLTLKTSLHKYWQNRNFGKLRNDNLFTISEAKSAIGMLLNENRLNRDKVYITQFEIGLNLNVSFDPLTFIELALFIPTVYYKEMFNDANYRKNRQRTTDKYKDIRKYFKIYDKSWQMQDKDRGVSIEDRTDSKKILRIETCNKRCKTNYCKFFSDSNINRITARFYSEWKTLNFQKEVIGIKGCRTSEVEKAKILINKGKEFLMELKDDEFKKGIISFNQHRTMREFIRDFDKLKSKFNIVISEQENEYNKLLFNTFKIAKI